MTKEQKLIKLKHIKFLEYIGLEKDEVIEALQSKEQVKDANIVLEEEVKQLEEQSEQELYGSKLGELLKQVEQVNKEEQKIKQAKHADKLKEQQEWLEDLMVIYEKHSLCEAILKSEAVEFVRYDILKKISSQFESASDDLVELFKHKDYY